MSADPVFAYCIQNILYPYYRRLDFFSYGIWSSEFGGYLQWNVMDSANVG